VAYEEWLPEAPQPKQGLLLDTEDRGTFIFDPIALSKVALAKKTLRDVEEFVDQAA